MKRQICFQLLMVGIAFQLVLLFLISQKRLFDFDEFQVIYASAALLRGKALYADQIGTHFPLMNLFFSLFLKIYGFHETALPAARVLIVFGLLLTLFFTYRIGCMIRGKEAGLLAVLLVLSSLAFINKGIEIRHEVFNMLFNTIGAFFALRYIRERNVYFLFCACLFLGMALASTQKAVIWNAGIVAGLLISLYKEKFRIGVAALIFSLFSIFIPLILLSLLMFWRYGETVDAFFHTTILNTLGYVSLSNERLHPFPFSKTQMYFRLLADNGLFYGFAITGGIYYALQKEKEKWIIIFWGGVGLSFFLYIKWPIYHNILPTMPVLGISAALLLVDFRDRLERYSSWASAAIPLILVILMLVQPIRSQLAYAMMPSQMGNQIQNVSFCLKYLQPDDKVLSFTQQQVFFDSVFPGMAPNECGESIYSIDESCFVEKIIDNQCKIIIYDKRTLMLKDSIKNEIMEHYRYSGAGQILIPGMISPPLSTKDRKIWISGVYLCSASGMMINGKEIKGDRIYLDRGEYVIRNLNQKPVALIYDFLANGHGSQASAR